MCACVCGQCLCVCVHMFICIHKGSPTEWHDGNSNHLKSIQLLSRRAKVGLH